VHRKDRRGVITEGGATEQPLSVNLYVNFAYNSAELTSDARITLDGLGTALRDPRLASFSFVIAGHTDAKGGADFNQKLSERRASAVRDYLIGQFSIAAERLTAKGYGKSQLLDQANPEDGVNRRVQVINLTAASPRN
jgi:outer membrane protein OmpA-like peptidoglycan-associated protein